MRTWCSSSASPRAPTRRWGRGIPVWVPGASEFTCFAAGRDFSSNVPVRKVRSHSSANKEAQIDV